ncbi:Hypothetical protein, putative [Bodo saltans]|uniref:Uncharacterized protein n=1 Tax=Bodo saltans TaxID=75058 RepID=A0A0S4JF98_BODSA|nr:Hypothetical protein, putative [Bodo saltans]|eukprot:CUG87826.1 Hypothetical protein, putative [Bodo saltans]
MFSSFKNEMILLQMMIDFTFRKEHRPRMATIQHKLHAIETEIARKSGEVHVVVSTLREAKQTTADLNSAIDECQRRLAALRSSQPPQESDAADVERDLLSKAVVRTQQRRQSVQRQLEEHLQRDDELRKAMDRAKAELTASAKKTMELRRVQRKLEREVQEINESKKAVVSTFETSSKRTKILAAKSATLSALAHDEMKVRDATKAECVNLTQKQDALSKLLTDTRERCAELFALIELSSAQVNDVPAAAAIIDEDTTTLTKGEDGSEAQTQSLLIAEYRATIERLLTQATA